MREPPALLDPERLREALEAAYGLAVADLRFLPLGYDSSAWVYRVEGADGVPRFLKLRAGPLNVAGLRVPHLLHASGVPGIVAPLPSRAGELWATLDSFAMILYPFVDGPAGMAAGLTDAQWVAYGAALRAVHATPVPPGLAALMRRETYAPPGADTLREVDVALQAGPDDPAARSLAGLWRGRRGEILGLLERAEGLGRNLAARELPEVLCHGDIHTGNVLRDGAERVWLVDWDEAVLAPKERDLMFVVGGISAQLVSPSQEALCLQGYGEAPIDRAALAYYRHAWAVSDIASFAADVLFRPDLSPAARAHSASMLTRLFAPGEIISIAAAEPA